MKSSASRKLCHAPERTPIRDWQPLVHVFPEAKRADSRNREAQEARALASASREQLILRSQCSSYRNRQRGGRPFQPQLAARTEWDDANREFFD